MHVSENSMWRILRKLFWETKCPLNCWQLQVAANRVLVDSKLSDRGASLGVHIHTSSLVYREHITQTLQIEIWPIKETEIMASCVCLWTMHGRSPVEIRIHEQPRHATMSFVCNCALTRIFQEDILYLIEHNYTILTSFIWLAGLKKKRWNLDRQKMKEDTDKLQKSSQIALNSCVWFGRLTELHAGPYAELTQSYYY